MQNTIQKRPTLFMACGLIFCIIATVCLYTKPLWANVTASQLCTAMVGKSYAVTQGYLNYSKDNATKDDFHAGIDYGVPQGTLVRTVVSGKLVAVDPTIGSIGIDDGNGVTFYLHMRNLKLKNTDIGKSYAFGTPIGEVSNQGTSKVHLHIEVRRKTLTYPNPTQPVGEGSVGSTASLTYNPLTYFGN